MQSTHATSSYHQVGEFKFAAAISQAVFPVDFVYAIAAFTVHLNVRDQDISNGVSFIEIGASGVLCTFKFQVSSINQVFSQNPVLKFKVYVRLKKGYQHM